MANLVEKIQNVRVELAQQKIVMTGKNTFAKYDYFELADFIKPLNELMLKHRMTAIPSFTSEKAILTAYDFDSDATLVIESPFSSADLKGCHDVQNVGAVETYQRRYLYQAMFDIAESDGLNAMQGKDLKGKEEKREQKKEEKNLPFPEQGVNAPRKTQEELKAERQVELMKLGAEFYPETPSDGWQNVLKEIAKNLGKKFSELTEKEYSEVVENIKARKY